MSKLVEQLRSVDHGSVTDCFMQSPLFEKAADAITALEAENAGLKAELAAVKEMYAREGAKALYELERAERAEARLAEALKALDDIETHARLVPIHTSQVTAGQLMSSKLTMIRDIASKAARRVREGGKVDG